MKTLQQHSHGGVSVYGKRDKQFSRLHFSVHNLEYVAFHIISHVSVVVVVIYRPPSYKMQDFIENLKKLVSEIHEISTRCIVMGDFNENLLGNDSFIEKAMIDQGYKQYVTDPTTENATLIDHVYARGIDHVNTSIRPIYYSYHEAIRIEF